MNRLSGSLILTAIGLFAASCGDGATTEPTGSGTGGSSTSTSAATTTTGSSGVTSTGTGGAMTTGSGGTGGSGGVGGTGGTGGTMSAGTGGAMATGSGGTGGAGSSSASSGTGGAGPNLCDTTFCVGDATSCAIDGVHIVDCNCTFDFGDKTVTINKAAKLEEQNACGFTILAGTLIVRGELESLGGSISIAVQNDFSTEVLNASAGRVDAHDGGSIDVQAGGAVTIAGTDFQTNGGGGIDGGDVDITAGGCVTIEKPMDASGGGNLSYGGWVTIKADCITVNASVLTNGGQDGDGGDIDLDATNALVVNGIVNASGSGADAWGGWVTLHGGSVAINANVNSTGGNAGVGGDIDITSATTINTAAGAKILCTASGGGDGCAVAMSAMGDIVIESDVDAGASGIDASAGSIEVMSMGGDVTILSTAVLAADTGASGFFDGTIDVSGCNVTISGKLDSLAGPDDGENTVTVRQGFFGSAATLQAGGSGENELVCRCVDANPMDGVCDLPATCAVAPVTAGGNFNPALVVTPKMLMACP